MSNRSSLSVLLWLPFCADFLQQSLAEHCAADDCHQREFPEDHQSDDFNSFLQTSAHMRALPSSFFQGDSQGLPPDAADLKGTDPAKLSEMRRAEALEDGLEGAPIPPAEPPVEDVTDKEEAASMKDLHRESSGAGRDEHQKEKLHDTSQVSGKHHQIDKAQGKDGLHKEEAAAKENDTKVEQNKEKKLEKTLEKTDRKKVETKVEKKEEKNAEKEDEKHQSQEKTKEEKTKDKKVEARDVSAGNRDMQTTGASPLNATLEGSSQSKNKQKEGQIDADSMFNSTKQLREAEAVAASMFNSTKELRAAEAAEDGLEGEEEEEQVHEAYKRYSGGLLNKLDALEAVREFAQAGKEAAGKDKTPVNEQKQEVGAKPPANHVRTEAKETDAAPVDHGLKAATKPTGEKLAVEREEKQEKGEAAHAHDASKNAKEPTASDATPNKEEELKEEGATPHKHELSEEDKGASPLDGWLPEDEVPQEAKDESYDKEGKLHKSERKPALTRNTPPESEKAKAKGHIDREHKHEHKEGPRVAASTNHALQEIEEPKAQALAHDGYDPEERLAEALEDGLEGAPTQKGPKRAAPELQGKKRAKEGDNMLKKPAKEHNKAAKDAVSADHALQEMEEVGAQDVLNDVMTSASKHGDALEGYDPEERFAEALEDGLEGAPTQEGPKKAAPRLQGKKRAKEGDNVHKKPAKEHHKAAKDAASADHALQEMQGAEDQDILNDVMTSASKHGAALEGYDPEERLSEALEDGLEGAPTQEGPKREAPVLQGKGRAKESNNVLKTPAEERKIEHNKAAKDAASADHALQDVEKDGAQHVVNGIITIPDEETQEGQRQLEIWEEPINQPASIKPSNDEMHKDVSTVKKLGPDDAAQDTHPANRVHNKVKHPKQTPAEVSKETADEKDTLHNDKLESKLERKKDEGHRIADKAETSHAFHEKEAGKSNNEHQAEGSREDDVHRIADRAETSHALHDKEAGRSNDEHQAEGGAAEVHASVEQRLEEAIADGLVPAPPENRGLPEKAKAEAPHMDRVLKEAAAANSDSHKLQDTTRGESRAKSEEKSQTEEAGTHGSTQKAKKGDTSHVGRVLHEAAKAQDGSPKKKMPESKHEHKEEAADTMPTFSNKQREAEALQDGLYGGQADQAEAEDNFERSSPLSNPKEQLAAVRDFEGIKETAENDDLKGQTGEANSANHVSKELAKSKSQDEQQKEKPASKHKVQDASHMKHVLHEAAQATDDVHKGKSQHENREREDETSDATPVDDLLKDMEQEQANGRPRKGNNDLGEPTLNREQDKADDKVVEVSGQHETRLRPEGPPVAAKKAETDHPFELPTDEADKASVSKHKYREEVEDTSAVNEVLKRMEQGRKAPMASDTEEESTEDDDLLTHMQDTEDAEAEQTLSGEVAEDEVAEKKEAKAKKHLPKMSIKAVPHGDWKVKVNETRKLIEADKDTEFQEGKHKQGPGDLDIFPSKPDAVWKYLPYASGVPVRCGPPMMITCASDDGVTCQFGVYGQEYAAFSTMSNVNASNPVKLDCPGWDLKGDTDACEALDCYQSVGFGVLLKNWYDVDIKTNTFTADIVLTLRWFNPLATRVMASSAGQKSMSTAEARQKNLWLPDIAVSNRDVNGTEVISSSLLIDKSGSCQLVERLLVNVREEFKPEAFPFDIQNLNIKLASTNKMAAQLKLEPIGDEAVMGVDPAKFDKSEYEVMDVNWKAYIETDANLVKSRGVLTLTLRHQAASWITSMIMPTLAITMMGALAFYFPLAPPFAMPRLSLSAFGLLILIVIRARVETNVNMYPKVWTDNLYCSCLALTFSYTLFNAWLEYLQHELKFKEAEGSLPRRMNNELKLFFPVLYAVVCAIVFSSRTGEYANIQGWALTTVIGLSVFGYAVHSIARVYKLKSVR